MKKVYVPLLAMAIAALNGCQKSDVYLSGDNAKAKNEKESKLKKKSEAEITCAIQQIAYQLGNTNDILHFTYNTAGNPVSITRNSGGHTGYPDYAFTYDQNGRLTDFIGPYSGNTNAEFWHKYYYDDSGNIVLDSAYIFPSIANGSPENAYMRELTYYTYDDAGRMVKDSTVFSGSNPSEVHTYSYDAGGNRVGGVYDNKININRTNKIWMFLNRDYSVNNPFTANSYNTTGLPVSINLPAQQNALLFLGDIYSNAQIGYSCDAQQNNQAN